MNLRFLQIFRDEEDTAPSFIRLTRTLLIIIMVANFALLPLVSGATDAESKDMVAFTFLLIALCVEGISFYFVNQGKPAMAKAVVPAALLLTITFTASSDNGLRDLSIVGIPLVLVISALLLGKRSTWIVSPIAVLSIIYIAYADVKNDKPVDPGGWTQAAIIIVLVILTSAVLQMLLNRLYESINKSRENEQLQILENRELSELRQTLEERVSARTSELEKSNHAFERRARQFEAIAQVTRVITAIQDLDILLPYITQVISEQFGIYHTGIFLLDKQREFAVLRAANSDGGRRMLMRGHKLRVGQTGIIGFVTATGQPRIALDVGTDATYFNNPDLPNTHSEVGLPLRYAGQVIGALDVQSTERNAFLQDDIDTLLTLADQVSSSINTAIILEDIRSQMEEYQRSIAESTRESWKVMRPKSLGMGFEIVKSEIRPLSVPLDGGHIIEAINENRTIITEVVEDFPALALPIRLRGKVVGVINLRANQKIKLSEDDQEIVEAIAERLSFALETATLLQATRHRADVERLTTEISSKISSSSRFDTILQTAAQELSRALGGSDVLVQIEPLSLELSMS